MFKEYDVVTNNKELKNVPKGTKGTVLLCYENSKDYEVEFVDNNYNTLSITTVSEKDLEPASHQ